MGCCNSCDDGGPCNCGTPGCTGGCGGHSHESEFAPMPYALPQVGIMLPGELSKHAGMTIGAAAGQGSYRDDTRELANYMTKGGQICTSGFDWGSFLSTIPLHIGNWCAVADIYGAGNLTLYVLPTGMIVPTQAVYDLFSYMVPGYDLTSYLAGVPDLQNGGSVLSACMNEIHPSTSGMTDDAYQANFAYCVNCYGWAMGTKDAANVAYQYGGGAWNVPAAARLIPIYFGPAGPNYVDQNGAPILFAQNIKDILQNFDMGTTLSRAQSGQGGTTVGLKGFVQQCADGSVFGYAGPPTASGQDIPGYGSIPNPYYDPSQPVSPTNQPTIPAGPGTTFPTGSPYPAPGSGQVGPSGYPCIPDPYGSGTMVDPTTYQPCALGPYAGGGYNTGPLPPSYPQYPTAPYPSYPPQSPYYPDPSAGMYPPMQPQMPYGYPDPSQFWQPMQTPDPYAQQPQFYTDPSGYSQGGLNSPYGANLFPIQQGGGLFGGGGGLLAPVQNILSSILPGAGGGGGGLFGGGGGGGLLPDISGLLGGILSMVPNVNDLLGSIQLPDIGSLLQSLPLPDVFGILGSLGIDLSGLLGGIMPGSGGGFADPSIDPFNMAYPPGDEMSGYDVGAAINPLVAAGNRLINKAPAALLTAAHPGAAASTTPAKKAPNATLQKAAGSPVLWKRLSSQLRKVQLQRYRSGHNSRSPAPDYAANVKKAAQTALNTGALTNTNNKANAALHLAASGNLRAANQVLSGVNKSIAASVIKTGALSTALGQAGARAVALNKPLSSIAVRPQAATLTAPLAQVAAHAMDLSVHPSQSLLARMQNSRGFGVSGDYDNAGAASAFTPQAYGYQTPLPSDFYATYFYQGDQAFKHGPPVIDPNYPPDDSPAPMQAITADPTLLGIPSQFAFGPQLDELQLAALGIFPGGDPSAMSDPYAEAYPADPDAGMFPDGGDPYALPFDPNSPTGNPYDPNAYGQTPEDPYANQGGGYPADAGAGAGTDPSVNPTTGLPWNIDPSTGQPWGTLPAASTAPLSIWQRAGITALNPIHTMPLSLNLNHGGIPAAGHTAFTPMPIAHNNVALTPPPPVRSAGNVALHPIQSPSRAGHRMMGEVSGGLDFGDILSSVTNVITKKGKEDATGQGGPTTDALNKAAAQKPGGSDQLVNDIVDNVIKYAPLLVAILGPSYDDATADALYILAKNGDKAAVHELFQRSKIGDPQASAMVRLLFGLPTDLSSLVSGEVMGDWTMSNMLAPPAMDEIEMDDASYGVGAEVSPYGYAGPSFMGAEVSPYGYAGPSFMGAEVSPYGYAGPSFVGGDEEGAAFIETAVAHSCHTVQRLMDMARAGDSAAQDAIVSIYRAAKAGNPDAQAVVMLTARTPQMPYRGTAEKRANVTRSWGPFTFGVGCGY